jgi:outer membrane protein
MMTNRSVHFTLRRRRAVPVEFLRARPVTLKPLAHLSVQGGAKPRPSRDLPRGHALRTSGTARATRLSIPMVIAWMLSGSVAIAEDPLSIREAISLALLHSPEAAMAAAEVDVARADVDGADGRRLPRIDLSADYTLTTNPVMVFGNLLRQRNFTAADFGLDSLNNPDPLSNWNATASLTQPIYAGGTLAAHADASRLEVEARAAESERARQQVRFAVLNAFGDAVLARHQLDVATQVVATAEAHAALVGDLADVGMVVDADLLQARLRTSEAKEAQSRAEGAVRVSQAALNLLIGRPASSPVSLPQADELTADLLAAQELDALIARAIENRPDLAAAQHRTEAAERGVDAARGARLPHVGLWAAFETNAHDFFGADGTNWTVMAQARWTVFDGSQRSAEVAKAEIRNRQAADNARRLERDLLLSVYQAHDALATARERLIQAGAAIELARASLVTVEDRYREGMVTVVELLDAQTGLTRALARDVTARRDIVVAAAALQLAIGEPTAAVSPARTESSSAESSR